MNNSNCCNSEIDVFNGSGVNYCYCNFSSLVGKTINDIFINEDKDKVLFLCDNGKMFIMYHEPDCCEDVYLEDIDGDLNLLRGAKILSAEVSESRDIPPLEDNTDSYTWTFYKISTVNGYVTMRWYGTSNGYYSESVDFAEVVRQ